MKVSLMLAICCCFAIACSRNAVAQCDCSERRVTELKQNSEAAFVGTVLKISESGEVRFRVEKIWKGIVSERVIIYSGTGSCAARFKLGKPYLVFANRREGEKRLTTEFCLTSSYISQEDLKALGQPIVVKPPKVKNR